jgi:2'-5' RNA ligase
MRLFTGISIPAHITAALTGAVAELRSSLDLRWSPPENLHITTKFIGQWTAERLPELQRTLASLDTPEPFEVTVAAFGFLPNSRRPKILCAGIEANARLTELASATDRAATRLGVKGEDRAYNPHVTLARLRGERLEVASAPEFGSFPVREFHLYESRPGPAASRYSILSSYPLTKAGN